MLHMCFLFQLFGFTCKDGPFEHIKVYRSRSTIYTFSQSFNTLKTRPEFPGSRLFLAILMPYRWPVSLVGVSLTDNHVVCLETALSGMKIFIKSLICTICHSLHLHWHFA